MQILSKLPNVGTTIFTTMSVLAQEHGAINLGQGFPDFMMSEELIDLVNDSMKAGNNQYVHMNGLPALREELSKKCLKLYNNNIDVNNEITITPGGTYAIYTALTTVLNKGDEVIVFEPAYDSYIPNIEINGAIPVLISLQYPSYRIPWDEVRAKITANTKMIMINSPHNPTGMVLDEEDINQLKQIVAEHDLFILSDEVYEHLIFDDKKHLSMLNYPELFERSFVCFSFGKTYHCTGWKLGYCIAPKPLMQEFRKVHQFNCFSCNSPVQFALATYLKNENAYLSLGKQLQQKRDYFRTLMQQTPFKLIPSHGSYFECYSYEGFSEQNDFDLAVELTKNYGIATIPVSSFYKNKEDNKVLRFCFAKKEETLYKAFERLKKIKF
ncbi:MAG: aminotransferase class I/II-fold pyridoxal phosphate-dependent enzyme [Chitinophagaceae bacterium]|nr:aminotransferase class I/II-fold pyridoxal phosphate-dependent enzyme [Chitinophagaceae bacterium]